MKSTLGTTRTLGVAAILGLGLTAQVSAAPLFTIDPSAVAGTTIAPYTADQINTQSSTLVNFDFSNETATGAGYLKFTGMAGSVSDGASPNLSNGATGLDVDYQVWIEFTYDLVKQPTSTFANFDSSYFVTSLDFTLYGDAGFGTTFTQATAGGAGTAPSVTPAGTATVLGSGSLINIPGLQNVVQGNDGSGAAFNTSTAFGLTTAGENFFVAPNPFYDAAFESITNDAGGFTMTEDDNGAVIQGAGTATFIASVPEPTTLALLGFGLLGFGAASTRRRQI